MMTKAFLYDSLCGMVYRCMFAGIDELGHAQWVSVTPGEVSKTLDEIIEDEELGDTRFILIALEGEKAQTEQVAKVLGKVAECPIEGLGADLALAVRQMRRLGVEWDGIPLNMKVRVIPNTATSKRTGKYSVWIEDADNGCSNLADLDGFDDLDDLMGTLRTYFLILELEARIPIHSKSLHIKDALKKEVRKKDLDMFDSIENEFYEMAY